MRANTSTKNLKVKDGPAEANGAPLELGNVIYSGGGTYWDVNAFDLLSPEQATTEVGAVARIQNLATPHYAHLKWQGRFEMSSYGANDPLTDIEATLSFALNPPGGGIGAIPHYTWAEGQISSLRVSFRTYAQPVVNVFLSGVAILPAGTSYISPWFGPRIIGADNAGAYQQGRAGNLFQTVNRAFEEWDIRILGEANLTDSTNGIIADKIEADYFYQKVFATGDESFDSGFEADEITALGETYLKYQYGVPGYPDAQMANSFHWEPFITEERYDMTGMMNEPEEL